MTGIDRGRVLVLTVSILTARCQPPPDLPPGPGTLWAGVCDSVASAWSVVPNASVTRGDSTRTVAADQGTQTGCRVVAIAPQGLDSLAAAGLYWSRAAERHWTPLWQFSADGPDGSLLTWERSGVRCEVRDGHGGGDDTAPDQRPDPAVTQETFCWEYDGLPAVTADSSTPRQPVEGFGSPGRWLPTGVASARCGRARQCLTLPWTGANAGLSDSVVSHTCQVAAAAPLGASDGVRWSFAIYHHRTVYGPTAATRPDDRQFFPDTVREAEVVVFGSGGDGAIRPLWHDRLDLELTIPQPPRLRNRAEGRFLELTTCLNGTGGCNTEVFRLTARTPWPLLRQSYREQLQRLLPGGWELRKGFQISLDSMRVQAGIYLPGDGNCCPAYLAKGELRLDGDELQLDSLSLDRDSTGFEIHRTIVPGQTLGAIDRGASERQLIDRLGTAQVTQQQVHLGEGICTPGSVIHLGTPEEAELAWTDSSRSSVAFIRISRRPSSWRTVRGVTTGTRLEELVRLKGGPVRFMGFGWDYGGNGSWSEPLPTALDSTGTGSIMIRLAPDSMSRERLHAPNQPGMREIMGDREISSEHAMIRRLGIEVVEIQLRWREPQVQRDCER